MEPTNQTPEADNQVPEADNQTLPDEVTETKKEKLDIGKEFYEWSQALMQAIMMVLLLFAFVACVFSVKGESMLDTLEDKEMLLISRLFYTPDYGDIVMFTKYGLKINGLENPTLVKRVIGIGGDTITLDAENRQVLRNGQALDEPYIRELMLFPNYGESEFVIPEGMVFVMGDNRNNSHDSRSEDVSFVDERFILGRVLIRITPIQKFGFVE